MTWCYSIEGSYALVPSFRGQTPNEGPYWLKSHIELRRKSLVDANVIFYEATSDSKVLPEIGNPAWNKKVELLFSAALCSSVQAVSFIPKNPIKYQTLFIRKIPKEDLSDGILSLLRKMIHTTWLRYRDGFIKPFEGFPRYDKAPLGYVIETPADAHILKNDQVDFQTDPQISAILHQFLQDPESESIAISSVNDLGKEILSVWSKEDHCPHLLGLKCL